MSSNDSNQQFAVGIDDLFWVEAEDTDEAVRKLRDALPGDASDLDLTVHDTRSDGMVRDQYPFLDAGGDE